MTRGAHVVAAIGNTSCRLALVRGGESTAVESFTHEEWREGTRVRAWLVPVDAATPIGICSVVPSLTERLREHLEATREIAVITAAGACAMRVEYETPATLGADRYCAALGARELCGSPVLAVDFGTAITVNVVDARGVFVGGAIVPGFAAALQAMHETTAQLPPLDPGDEDALDGRESSESGRTGSPPSMHSSHGAPIGHSTRASMQTGVVEVLARGVDAYVRAVAAKLAGTHADAYRSNGPDYPLSAAAVPICCTGGGAARFLRVVGGGWVHDPELVLRGAAAELRCREALEGL